MKKVLSVFLAVLMALSVMAIAATAEETPYVANPNFYGVDSSKQTVFRFRLNGGNCKSGQYIYNTETGKIENVAAEDVPDTFYLVPREEYMYREGAKVTLPDVVAKKGQSFQGWERVPTNAQIGTDPTTGQPITDNDNSVYSVAGTYTVKGIDIGTVVEFHARYGEAQMEEDTFSKVFEILTKIFGTLIGLIAYQGNIEKGQEFMKTIFASLG